MRPTQEPHLAPRLVNEIIALAFALDRRADQSPWKATRLWGQVRVNRLALFFKDRRMPRYYFHVVVAQRC